MRVREFKSEILLPRPPGEIFPFFADAANLEILTPSWLSFKVLTPPPIVMHEGAVIDYQLRIHGIPVRWRTRIAAWQPPHRFVDEQLSGPYRQWIHEHTFEVRNGGTLARDVVQYAAPFDFVLHRWFVRPDIERIFRYRSEVLQQRFAAARPA